MYVCCDSLVEHTHKSCQQETEFLVQSFKRHRVKLYIINWSS